MAMRYDNHSLGELYEKNFFFDTNVLLDSERERERGRERERERERESSVGAIWHSRHLESWIFFVRSQGFSL